MIDRSALCQQIKLVNAQLTENYAQEYMQFVELFKKMIDDDWLKTVNERVAPWLVADWRGALDAVVPLRNCAEQYQVTAVDGSQVYPDRHEGSLCALINVGGITIGYGANAYARLYSAPYIYANNDGALTPEIIDCLRQEHELGMACQHACSLSGDHSVVLVDGSLIAWQLHDKPEVIKNRYLTSYLAYMQTLYEARIMYAGYVSVPHNRDIAHLVRWYARERFPEFELSCATFIDSDLFEHVLARNTRSTLCESRVQLCKDYPVHLQPLFFYVRVGDEVGRVEVPRWVCDDSASFALLEQVVYDQCIKGQGYPIALAEAHAQAVVKGADRALFYQLIARQLRTKGAAIAVSRKLLSKRRLCV